MSLTAEQETLEFSLKVAQMEADIALKTEQAKKVRQDWRLDPQRVVIQAFLAGAAIIGSVTGTVGYLLGAMRGH